MSSTTWYKKWWGVVLLAGGGAILLFVIYVGFLTTRFYKQIRLGDIPAEVQSRLTSSSAIQTPKNLKENLAYAVADDPSFGNPNAPIQIVEFADFECPFSREESLVIRELTLRFPDKIHFVYRDFPLQDIHPHAFRAAEAANCAADQDKFWPMHDKLYQNANRLTDADIKRYALETGQNIAQFNACLDSRKYKAEIDQDYADGVAAGVKGTPTFFINGARVPGAIPLGLWEQIVGRVK